MVIESLAVGTPVVGWRRGAMPELIDDGKTGFVVADTAEAIEALARIGDIDRTWCRAVEEDSATSPWRAATSRRTDQ